MVVSGLRSPVVFADTSMVFKSFLESAVFYKIVTYKNYMFILYSDKTLRIMFYKIVTSYKACNTRAVQ